MINDCIFSPDTDSGQPSYTLSEAVEKIGFGKFQMNIIWMVGFFVVSIPNLNSLPFYISLHVDVDVIAGQNTLKECVEK